jgi:hypothetical protein
MQWLVKEIAMHTPIYEGDDPNQWDDQLWLAIEKSLPLVTEFTRVAIAATSHKHAEAISALHGGFAGIFNLYRPPAGTRYFRDCDTDYPRFVGHELLVTLVATLVVDERWEIVADFLGRDFVVTNSRDGRPAAVDFSYESRQIELLEHRRRRQGINIICYHSQVLKERHQQEEIGSLLSWQQFMEADYLLFLRGQLQHQENDHSLVWRPWSNLYLRNPPGYLLRAVSKREAERLLPVLSVPDIQTLRTRLAHRAGHLRRLFPNGLWDHPLDESNVATIGTR